MSTPYYIRGRNAAAIQRELDALLDSPAHDWWIRQAGWICSKCNDRVDYDAPRRNALLNTNNCSNEWKRS